MFRAGLRFLTPIAFVMLLAISVAYGQDRSFTGSYQVLGATPSGDAVKVTVTLTLTNYSGGDIRDGSVVLLSSDANPQLLGRFTSMPLFKNAQLLKISHVFSVSKEEYALWRSGRDPVLRFQLPGSTDPTMATRIDLRRVSLINPAS